MANVTDAKPNLYKTYLDAADVLAKTGTVAAPKAPDAAAQVGQTDQSTFTAGGKAALGAGMLLDDRAARSKMGIGLQTSLAQITNGKFGGNLTADRLGSLFEALNNPEVAKEVTGIATGRIHNAWWAANPNRVLGNKADLKDARDFALPVDVQTLKPDLSVFSGNDMKEMAKGFLGGSDEKFVTSVKGNNEAAARATFGALRGLSTGLEPLSSKEGYENASQQRWKELSQAGTRNAGPTMSPSENVATAARLISDLLEVKELLDSGKSMETVAMSRPEATALLAHMHDSFVGFRLETKALYDDTQKVPSNALDSKVLAMDVEPLVHTLASAVAVLGKNAPVAYS